MKLNRHWRCWGLKTTSKVVHAIVHYIFQVFWSHVIALTSLTLNFAQNKKNTQAHLGFHSYGEGKHESDINWVFSLTQNSYDSKDLECKAQATWTTVSPIVFFWTSKTPVPVYFNCKEKCSLDNLLNFSFCILWKRQSYLFEKTLWRVNDDRIKNFYIFAHIPCFFHIVHITMVHCIHYIFKYSFKHNTY